MKAYGQPLRAGIGGVGIEVPIDPPASNPTLTAAREQRRIAAIEAAEAAATAASGGKQTRRSAGSNIWTLPSTRPSQEFSAPEPTVPAAPSDPVAKRTIRQLTADLASATAQITALRSQVSDQAASLIERATGLIDARAQLDEAHAEAQAATERAETGAQTIRQLKTELAMAGQRITSLRSQVSEQGACLVDVCTELDQARAELAEARVEVHAATVRAEVGERALAETCQRIQAALVGDIATALPAEPAHADQLHQDLPDQGPVEPVMCEGGCGVPVDPAYVQRIKRRLHGGHCADLAAAADDRSPGRRAVA